MGKVELLSEATKYYKLKSERRGRIAKDWLNLEDCGPFMAKLFGEMISNGILLEAEAHRLAAVEQGIDLEKLAYLAKSKRDEPLSNLTSVFIKESAALNDSEWDAEEHRAWSQRINSDLEERVTKTDWTSLSFEVQVIPQVPDRSILSTLEQRCSDLSGNLMTEKEAISDLASELDAKEPLTFDFEELLHSKPSSPQSRSPSPVTAANEQAE